MCPLEMVSNKFKDLQRQDINNLFMYLCSCQQQRAKQVVSDSPGLVDFASEFCSQLAQRAGKVF